MSLYIKKSVGGEADLDPVHLAINVVLVFLVETRREIKECPANKSDTVDGKEQPVDASPAERGFNKGIGDDGAEAGARETKHI